MEKITFQKNENETVEYYVLEQTRVSGVNYLLVSDVEKGDGEALILKETSGEEEKESGYTDGLSQEEIQAVLPIFEDLLDDVDFI